MAKESFLLVTLASMASAPPHSTRSLRELDRHDSPAGKFVKTNAAPEDRVFNLYFALAQNNLAALEQKPYAETLIIFFLRVEELVAPPPDSVSALDSWLSSLNLMSKAYSPAGDVRSVSLTVKQANQLLDAQYATFVDQKSGVKAVRTLSRSILVDLKEHINVVYPTTSFPVPIVGSAKGSTLTRAADSKDVLAAAPQSCATSFTLSCTQELYGIPTTSATESSNHLGVIGLSNEWIDNADLKMFLTKYRPDLPPSTSCSVVSISGRVNDESTAGPEADLDAQYTIGLASGVPVEFITVGQAADDPFDEPFTELIDVMSATASHSWVREESPFVLPLAIEVLLAKATQICATPLLPWHQAHAHMGGTQDVNPEVAGGVAELDEGSNSGFSNFFPMPDYQKADVTAYQKMLPSSYDGLYNKTSRGYPDVVARSTLIEYVWKGEYSHINGTSASTPVPASIAALLNDELVAAGKSPIGFMNPSIYANKGTFNDINKW
ncbi:subtilisin-like protein [Dentipellis sp. KUC8613]|nr:subtilisin-like protein [Dentipellis sp. KUC8613]